MAMHPTASRSEPPTPRPAHDLNGPFSACTMAASRMPAQIDGILAALDAPAQARIAALVNEWREAHSLLQSSLQRCLQILGNTPAGANHWPEASPSIDLQNALKSAVKIGLARRPDLQVQCQVHFAQPVQVRNDLLAWHQVMSNLVNNSLTHGFAGRSSGTIRITGALLPDQRVLVHYYDDGVGFTLPAFQRLFEEGFGTRVDQGGSGLGMGTVRDLVQRKMGGRIKVHRPAKGVHIIIEARI